MRPLVQGPHVPVGIVVDHLFFRQRLLQMVTIIYRKNLQFFCKSQLLAENLIILEKIKFILVSINMLFKENIKVVF